MNFSGTFTALITPFKDGKIDAKAFGELIERQIHAGISGIVPVGTTGESPTLDTEEHIEVIRLAVKYAAGRCLVIAGTGSNSTAEAIELTQEAEKVGADATLQVCPYYNKPSQAGLELHFREIAASTALPIILYSIPGRSVIEIAPDTTAKLASACKNIVAIKESGGSVDRVSKLIQACPADFTVLCGDDPLTLPFMACGAAGLISVSANLIPEVMVELVNSCASGEFGAALAIHNKFYRLISTIMSIDVNPTVIKTAMALVGMCEPDLRLPLAPMSAQNVDTLKELLRTYKLYGYESAS